MVRRLSNTFPMLLALFLAAASPVEPAAAEAAAPAVSARGVPIPPRGASKSKRAHYWRLVDHIKFGNCVRTNALAIARLDASPETLARAAVAFCHDEELTLWSSAVRECVDTGFKENNGGVCGEERMGKWRDIAEREAFGCIAGIRFKPAAVGDSICRMSDLSSAWSLSDFPSPQ